MSDDKPENQGIVPYEPTEEIDEYSMRESFGEVIKPLVPVMTSYLDHQKRVSEQQTKLQEQQLELARTQAAGNLEFAKERLKFEDKKLGRQFSLTVMLILPIVIVALGTAVGLIFLKDNVQAGVFLLTHLVAFAIGVVGGAGWQKAKQEPPRK
jgi:hypothetical protein